MKFCGTEKYILHLTTTIFNLLTAVFKACKPLFHAQQSRQKPFEHVYQGQSNFTVYTKFNSCSSTLNCKKSPNTPEKDRCV